MQHIDNSVSWRGGRVVEGARLESVYTPKGYRGFESRSLRLGLKKKLKRLKIIMYICNSLYLYNS